MDLQMTSSTDGALYDCHQSYLLHGNVCEIFVLLFVINLNESKDYKNHGKGTYIFPCVYAYDGEWKDGNKHGYGVLTFPNGESYEGQWKNREKHG